MERLRDGSPHAGEAKLNFKFVPLRQEHIEYRSSGQVFSKPDTVLFTSPPKAQSLSPSRLRGLPRALCRCRACLFLRSRLLVPVPLCCTPIFACTAHDTHCDRWPPRRYCVNFRPNPFLSYSTADIYIAEPPSYAGSVGSVSRVSLARVVSRWCELQARRASTHESELRSNTAFPTNSPSSIFWKTSVRSSIFALTRCVLTIPLSASCNISMAS